MSNATTILPIAVGRGEMEWKEVGKRGRAGRKEKKYPRLKLHFSGERNDLFFERLKLLEIFFNFFGVVVRKGSEKWFYDIC